MYDKKRSDNRLKDLQREQGESHLRYWMRHDGVLIVTIVSVILVAALLMWDAGTPYGSSAPSNDVPRALAFSEVGNDMYSGAAFLDVYTSPRQAQVILEDDTLGATPLVRSRLDAGERTVRITVPGYSPIDTTIVLRNDRPNRLFVSLVEDEQMQLSAAGNQHYRPVFPVASEHFETAKEEQQERVRRYLKQLQLAGQALSVDASAEPEQRVGW